ncbi:MAG: DUF1573 domain-containing protein [Bacteroidales bacterium]|nr:DUF1573 domain-containing protein [Bacteroidales bacterium]MDD2204392.1 DUF1573 domain-containing protein [Bacteroidales bacterium]MDD3152364.1 DUF1573 domain-containing protein [Bacteroidales bacterium]MDD3913836.1 DUF1573 domain-containing protein [Bacteroidales bacterium]MDD4634335.1 DUF1573 domain-containing protein [Bacteroidales bacterium]
MRHLFLFLIVVFMLFTSCNNDKKLSGSLVTNPITMSGDADMSKLPVIKFYKTSHDFGDLSAGESVRYSFKFKNEGKSDLLISKAKASCGCTVAEFPKTPIKPGEENYIDVTFDAKGVIGFQNKSIEVFTNAQPNVVTLTVRANVKRGR